MRSNYAAVSRDGFLAQILVDLSRAASIGDMRPNRLAVMAGVLQSFIRKFFDENPLSHLGIIIMRNGIAQRLTDLAGSPVRHLRTHNNNCSTALWYFDDLLISSEKQ